MNQPGHGPEQLPSLPLTLAGALARAGWTAERIADELRLPLAFAEPLHDNARQDGEATPGADARLLHTAAQALQHRRSGNIGGPSPHSSPSQQYRSAAPQPGGAGPTRRPSIGLAIATITVFVLAVLAEANRHTGNAERLALLLAALTCLALTIRQAFVLTHPPNPST